MELVVSGHEARGPSHYICYECRLMENYCFVFLEPGTYRGAGKFIKAARPDVKIVLAEPTTAPLVASGIATERLDDGSPKGTHPS